MPKTYPETLERVPLASQITQMLVLEIKTGMLPDYLPDIGNAPQMRFVSR